MKAMSEKMKGISLPERLKTYTWTKYNTQMMGYSLGVYNVILLWLCVYSVHSNTTVIEK
jgi:hypothetical protein